MNKLLICVAIIQISVSAFADDPWMPDTVTVGTVYVDFGELYVDVPLYTVTDEDVFLYNMPITWSIDADGIQPSEVFYYYPLYLWDETYDSVLVGEHYLRMLAWGDIPGHYLNTGGLRWRCWEIRFTIDSLAPPQYVAIDTTYDPINGSLFFGEVGGINSFTPRFVPGGIYYGIQSGICDHDRNLPQNLALLQNHPNPFNASTTIEFTLPEAAHAELSVYNILGQEVAVLFDGQKTAGIHSVTWDAAVAPSGPYFIRLKCGSFSESIKTLLLK